jgi:Tfp pilus assembly protein PilX
MRFFRQRGNVSLLALAGMLVVLTATIGVSGLSANSMRRSQRDVNSWIAFNAAQAGLELQIRNALDSLYQNNGVFTSFSSDLGPELDILAPGCVAVGNVSPQSNVGYAWVTSTVTYKGMSRSVRVLVNSKNVSIWNNAIFAGTGAAGGLINGNVDIRGSVHLLGDGESYTDLNGNGQWDPAEPFNDLNKNGRWDPGEPFTDINGDGVWNPAEPFNDTNGNGKYDHPLNQADLNSNFGGSAYIGNNYSGMPSALRNLVPPPPKVSGLESLSAEVRVKHGKIGLSGTATIGTNSLVDGGASKGKVDGVFVNDGFGGSSGSSSVFSDNGTTSTYDLGHLGIKFPLISGIGAQQYVDKQNSTWGNQEAFLDARALTIPVTEVTSKTAAFSYGPDAFGNSISFTPGSGNSPGNLTVHGVIRIEGDLQLGSKDTIHYSGNGTLYATNDLKIDGDILPAPGLTFPTTARMGFIAKRNMDLATGAGSSQLSMAGAFYAQGRITSRKQNQIAGTFVANFYDMGTNVPNIYQVPSLVYNMPPAMPGDRMIATIKTEAWRERKVN